MKLRREHITYCITFGCLPPSYPREGIFRFVCVSTPKYNHDFVCGVRKRKSRSFIFLVKTSSNRNEIYRIIQLNLLNVYSISRFSKCVASLVVLWVCHFQLDLSWIHSVSRYFQLKAFFSLNLLQVIQLFWHVIIFIWFQASGREKKIIVIPMGMPKNIMMVHNKWFIYFYIRVT